ncbi:MAG TPA: ABC transporter ATP-binding protein [Candidatus Limnocylindria bacterium]|nr:ABC transporter ATP-binding protein [Candidatus Limnocylindria bacterium]
MTDPTPIAGVEPAPAEPVVPAEPVTTPALAVDHVSRWYGNVVAINDVSFSLSGGVTGLLGPNGAGKSTLLHMLSGFLRPSTGSVAVEGTPTFGNPEVYRRIGLVPERESAYTFLTGREFVTASARLHQLADPEAAATRAIGHVEMAATEDRRIGTYSKGMRQRIKVASALVHDPPILLLDEPFNGMDPRQRLHMMELLRRMAAEGRTILFSSHILEEVGRLAEQVLVIVAGRLAASGDFREIRRLMTDRPHTFTVRSSDDRALAAVLVTQPSIAGVSLDDGMLTVRSTDFGAFSRSVTGLARRAGVSLHELLPTDESLESVFSYLVRR